MTHPTKALHKFMMQDFVRMGCVCSLRLLEHNSYPFHQLYFFGCPFLSFRYVHVVRLYHSYLCPSSHNTVPGCHIHTLSCRHVLGACMFLIDIAGLRILYTGDYSREEDRHLVKAEVPPIHPDVLIVESTYGVQSLDSRPEKELRFTNLVHSIIRRGGHVLLPTFALGRAQELLLILDEYWKKHPDLHNVPIYYASGLARKSMAVYQTYIHTMNSHIRSRFAKRDNPFVFKYVSSLLSACMFLTFLQAYIKPPQPRGWEKKIAEGPPCVVLASPGFMTSGPSRELCELWAPDSRNGLIITGYSIEGTLARVSESGDGRLFKISLRVYITRARIELISVESLSELEHHTHRRLSPIYRTL